MSSDPSQGDGGGTQAATILAGQGARHPVQALIGLLRGLMAVSASVGFAAFAAAALLTVADVVGRRLGMPIVGIVDLVQLFVLSGAWLVIPYAFVKGAHVGVDLLVEAFPKALNRVLRAVSSLVAVALLGLMLNACIDAYSQQLLFGDRSQQLGIPITWYWLPLLVGVALSIVAALLTLVDPPQPEASSL